MPSITLVAPRVSRRRRAMSLAALLHRCRWFAKHRAYVTLAAIPAALFALAPSTAFGAAFLTRPGDYPYCRINCVHELSSGNPRTDRLVNGPYVVVMQCDGNLVEYGPRGYGPYHAIWDTETGGHPGCPRPGAISINAQGLYTLDMEWVNGGNGDLVIRDHTSTTTGEPFTSGNPILWDSRTSELGNPRKYLALTPTGHLVIVRDQPGLPRGVVWDNTWPRSKPGVSNLNLGHFFGGL